MFAVKKILTPFIMPPGLFSIILLLTGLWLLYRRRSTAYGIFSLLLGCLIWISATVPFSNFVMKPLEAGLAIPKRPHADVIVVLGGGATDRVPDATGVGFPAPDSLGRLVTAARIQKSMDKPVILSSGQTFRHRIAEAPIARRILIDLGVPPDKIILEVKSRDTIENARYTREICERLGFRRPIIVTTACHMKRSVLSFQKAGMDVSVYPANFRYRHVCKYSWDDYLPDVGQMENVALALHEYIGLIFYKWFY